MWDYQYGGLQILGTITTDKCVTVDILDYGEVGLSSTFQLSEANNEALLKLIIWSPS